MAKGLRMSEADLAKFQGKAYPRGHAKKKAPKYHNQKVLVDGILFDSKGEAAYWIKLSLLEKSGEIRNLQRQVSFPLTVRSPDGAVRIQRYKVDFWWREQTDFKPCHVVVADYKSEFTRKLPAWPRTKALFEALYGLEIRELL